MADKAQRVRVINGYAAHARFLAECSEEPAGWVARQVGSPYSFGPDHALWYWQGQRVFIVETKHRRYEVFAVPQDAAVFSEPL